MGDYLRLPLHVPTVLMDFRSQNDLDSDRLRRIVGRHHCWSLDVFDPQDLDLLLAGRRAHPDDVAFEGAHERPRDGRDPAHVTAAGIDLVDAHDLDRALLALGVGVGDGGAEEDLVGLGPLGRIDHLRALQPLAEEADAPVDLAQPLLAVEIVAVLRAVAVGRRPRHDLHHLRPLLAHERHQLLAQALEALGSHVVLGAGGQARDLVGQIVVVLAVAFLGEGLAHFHACSIKNGPMTTTPSLLQRARGESRVAFDLREGRTRLRDLYQRDPCRVLFPAPEPGEPPLRGGTSVGPYAEVSLRDERRPGSDPYSSFLSNALASLRSGVWKPSVN